MSGVGTQREPPTGLAPGDAGRREVGEKRGARTFGARAPLGSARRGPQEEDTLCAALASGSGEGVGGAEPGAAPRSRPRSPGPRPPPRLSAAPSNSHSPRGCVVSAAAAAAATPAWVMIPSGFRRVVRPPGRISQSAAAACSSGAGGARAQALLSPRPRRLFLRPLPQLRARAFKAGDPAAARPQLSQPPSPRPSRPLPPPLPRPPLGSRTAYPGCTAVPPLPLMAPIRSRGGCRGSRSEPETPLRSARGREEVEGKVNSERASGGPMRRAGGRRCASWVEGTGNILKGRVMGRTESQ